MLKSFFCASKPLLLLLTTIITNSSSDSLSFGCMLPLILLISLPCAVHFAMCIADYLTIAVRNADYWNLLAVRSVANRPEAAVAVAAKVSRCCIVSHSSLFAVIEKNCLTLARSVSRRFVEFCQLIVGGIAFCCFCIAIGIFTFFHLQIFNFTFSA